MIAYEIAIYPALYEDYETNVWRLDTQKIAVPLKNSI